MKNLIREQVEKVNSAVSRINSLYGRWSKKYGLNYSSLMVICAMENTCGCNQKYICDKWMLPKQTVNTVLSDFKARGYVTFSTDPNDKREKIVRYTEDGQRFSDSVLSKLHIAEERAFAKLGNELRAHYVRANDMFCDFFAIEVKND